MYGRSRICGSVGLCDRVPRGSPRGHEDEGARQARDEHHDAVHDGGRDALLSAEAGHGEHPCRRALTRPPAGDAGQRSWPASRAAASGTSRETVALAPAVRAAITNVTACPATTSADASTIAGQAVRARRASRTSPAIACRTCAHLERPRVAHGRPPGRRSPHDERDHDEGDRGAHRRRQREPGRRR